MLPPVTKKYTDHSTDEHFAFSFYCDECGAVWVSEQYPFSLCRSATCDEGEKTAQKILWKTEHDAAYERANTEALFHFNKCPKCGKRVCDKCFSEFESSCLKCLQG